MKTNHDILLDAARRQALAGKVGGGRSTFSCINIWNAQRAAGRKAVSYGPNGLVSRYDTLFSPRHPETVDVWGCEWGNNRKQCRVLALCLAAAMAEAGDL